MGTKHRETSLSGIYSLHPVEHLADGAATNQGAIMSTGIKDVITYDLTRTKNNLLRDIDYLSELVAHLKIGVTSNSEQAAARAKMVAHTAMDVLIEAQQVTTLVNLENQTTEE